ncbi:MAG: UTP--glucose-1-phosphate uridylyltransferase [Chloroflexi bacterium]|nr:UTP--glucose-1-phosphate uridylyltransferase [Chloroflexota bacterium]|tara:strand:- start:200 stop:1000 length:801 start_codon:yes stop_codon:yes gene_type:complete
MESRVGKAVIPAAGLGTRFLPVTRAVSKVMLPVFNIPTIEFAVTELKKSGINSVAIVVSSLNSDVQKYFEGTADVQVEFILQEKANGLGDAILQAEKWVNGESFCVVLPDDLIFGEITTIKQMISIHSKYDSTVLALKTVEDDRVPFLGIVESQQIDSLIHRINKCVEKPKLLEAPSNLAIIGRYVFTNDIFDYIKQTTEGALGEIQITDAINAQANEKSVYGYEFPGEHFDTGNPAGLLEASIALAVRDPEKAPGLINFIKSLNL